MIRAAVSIAILLIAIAANAANVGVTSQIPSASSRPRPGPNLMIGESGGKPTTGFTDEVYYEWNTDKWWKGTGSGWQQMVMQGGGGGGGLVDQGAPGTQPWPVSISNTPIPVLQSGSWTVSVSNFPGTQLVSGSVSVTNLPGTQSVTGTVAATQSGTWNMRMQDGSGNGITSQAAGSTRPAHSLLVDTAGNPVTSLGGGTEYDTGTPSTGTDKLTLFGCVRKDVAGFPAGVVDGDRSYIQCDSRGNARVSIDHSIVGSGQSSLTGATTFNNPIQQSENILASSTVKQLMAPATAGERTHVGYLFLWAEGDGDVTIQHGTQSSSPCDSGTPVTLKRFKFDASRGYNAIMGSGGPGTIFETKVVNRQLCIANTTNAAVSWLIRYMSR